MPQVSVIVPIYGVEKYIERCVRSLFEQTLTDIEYIFVDDCTQDKSMEIVTKLLNDYPTRQSQVKIIHHSVNRGLPQARMTGINIATGEYIAHCDSDDWVEPNMYQDLYEKASSSNADVVICDIYISDDTSDIPHSGFINKNISKFNILSDMFQWKIPLAVWNKLVRRRVYSDHHIYYTSENIGEDLVLMVQLITYSTSFAYVQKNLYHYYCNSNSMCRIVDEEKQFQKFYSAINNLNFVIQFLKENGQYKKYKKQLCRLKFVERNLLLPVIRKSDRAWSMWAHTYPELIYQIWMCPLISIKEKLRTAMIYLKLYPRR